MSFAVGAAGGVAACHESKQEPNPTHPKGGPTAADEVAGSDGRDGGVAARDAGPAYEGPVIGALFRETSVLSEMDFPREADDRRGKEKSTSVRLGYLRQGAKVPVIPEPHPKPNCKEGWYELVQGGFVCGRYASVDLNHPRFKLAPHLPDLSTPLPYQYGYNITNGTPLYRTVPSREERFKLEPWLLAKKAKPKPREEEGVASYGDDSEVREVRDAGTPLTLAKTTTATEDPFGIGADALEREKPWYLRQYDGGKPTVTLDELRGEGPMARRMVRGFFVALDKEMNANGFKWWRTTNSLIAPHDRVFVHTTASKFHGVWLDKEEPPPTATADGGAPAIVKKPTPDIGRPGSKSQVAVVLFYKAHKYIVSTSRKAVTTGDPLPRHSVVKLTGDSVSVNGTTYDETDEGWWLRSAEATKSRPGDPPKGLAKGEKWIDVNLKTQMLVAYEGDKAVYATAVSSGKEDKEDEEKDHHTKPGEFRIREKHIAATMDGDVASDGPYSIEDVPWIMYYDGSYALHGAFWHNDFGKMHSHGCVNLAPLDAKALFGWTEPRVPEGWHGVMATTEKPGTRVIVHE